MHDRLAATARAIDAHARAMRAGRRIILTAHAKRQAERMTSISAAVAQRSEPDAPAQPTESLSLSMAEPFRDAMESRLAVLEAGLGELANMVGQMASGIETAIGTFAPMLAEIVLRQNELAALLHDLAEKIGADLPTPTEH